MSSITKSTSAPRSSTLRAYFELTKPRISMMVLITVVVAALLGSSTWPGIVTLLNASIAIALIAASGNAFNMYIERYTDFLMPRTAHRPLPDKRLNANQVAMFGAVCFGAGVSFMSTALNTQTAICGIATWILYVLVYTPLKTKTHYNTEIGAVAGAMPILLGALAASGVIAPIIWVFFAVLFCWQFPHFMAIAWMYRQQYEAGGLKMLTVVEPTGHAAGRKAVLYSVATWLCSLGPIFIYGNIWVNAVYAIIATYLAYNYFLASQSFFADRNDKTARKLLRVSITYLPAFMLLLVVASAVS